MTFLRFIPLFCLLAPGFCFGETKSSEPSASSTAPDKLVYVIPVRADIDQSIIYIIRRGVKEAIQANADAIVLHMDTYGGRVDIMEKIVQILRKFPHQEETYTFIDTKAISAGAFISSGTRHIYMAPGSVIGAAAPVMSSSGGEVVETPESYKEKIKSALKALVRANCELHGHDPRVFEAMIDQDEGLKIGDHEILPKGKLLTLTSKEALETYGSPKKPLISSGTATNLDAFIQKIGGNPNTAVHVKATGVEEISHWIVLISPFLLSAAFLLGYLEFQTPGFGAFGIGAILCALLFFFGHYVAGLSGYENVVILMLGVTLIAVEIFFMPGSMIIGLLGFFLVAIAFLNGMVDRFPTDPIIPTMANLEKPLTNLALTAVISVVGALLLAKFMPQTALFRRFVVEGATSTPIAESVSPLRENMTGEAITYLRPSGTAEFDGNPVDVITEGDFIEAGTKIRILRIEGSKVFVKTV